MIVGLLFGIAALTTANSGRTAWAGRQYIVQTAVSVMGVHGAEDDA